jgi:hypothetical protein
MVCVEGGAMSWTDASIDFRHSIRRIASSTNRARVLRNRVTLVAKKRAP